MNYDKIPSELKSLKQLVCAWNTSVRQVENMLKGAFTRMYQALFEDIR